MARTRSSKAAGGAATKSSAAPSAPSTTTSRFTIPPESSNPPKLFILPSRATPEATVVALLNPRYNKPTRYLVCPETGTYEFTRIAAPQATPRSWLIEGAPRPADAPGGADEFRAQVTRGAELYVATPVDPFFLVLPALAAQLGAERRLFLSADDHLDAVAERSPHQREALRRAPAARRLFEARMGAACDAVDAGGEPMFRLSEEKVLAEVLAKARRMSAAGLPRSMEEKFVTKALEAPILSVRSNHAPAAEAPAEPGDAAPSGATTPVTESAESQSGASTADTAASLASSASASTAATSVAGTPSPDAAQTSDITAAMQASGAVVELQRLRVAFDFICSSYVPPALAGALRALLAAGRGPVDFAPLDGYAARLARARQEALLARAASDYTGKRGREEEDEERAEKRRRKEEEEKRRKAGESVGVRKLKKVDVSGMKKMSDFFKKK